MEINELTHDYAIIDRTIDRVISTYPKVNDGQECDAFKVYEILSMTLEDNISFQKIQTRFLKIRSYKTILEFLKTIPVIEQRSPEWYEIRKNLVTASDMAQCLGKGKFGTINDIYKKKCGYEEIPFNADCPPLKWGVKYEPVATEIYSARNNVEVHEFGLIPHSAYSYFGASPDGITEQGVMLEIKCPYRRKIDGHIPDQYYYQIQGQLDTCGLEECDYLECKFVEYDNEYQFLEDSDNEKYFTADSKEKGIIVEYKFENEDIVKYNYCNLDMSDDDRIKWKEQQIELLEKSSNLQYYIVTYWKLEIYHVKRVYRDTEFFLACINGVEKFWNNVLRYRQNKEDYDKELNEEKKEKKSRKTNIKKIITLEQLEITKKIKSKTGSYGFLNDPEDDE